MRFNELVKLQNLAHDWVGTDPEATRSKMNYADDAIDCVCEMAVDASLVEGRAALMEELQLFLAEEEED